MQTVINHILYIIHLFHIFIDHNRLCIYVIYINVYSWVKIINSSVTTANSSSISSSSSTANQPSSTAQKPPSTHLINRHKQLKIIRDVNVKGSKNIWSPRICWFFCLLFFYFIVNALRGLLKFSGFSTSVGPLRFSLN